MFETMVVELEELLGRLTKINDKMMDYTHNLGMLQIVTKCRRNEYMGLRCLMVTRYRMEITQSNFWWVNVIV